MSGPVIQAEALGKRYRIGAQKANYRTLRDAIASPWREGHILRRVARSVEARSTGKPEMWAVKDLSFSIAPGEIVGVIGRNGAGKSTLLKLLCRITEPTHGTAVLRGRVGSLLEVGTGFHPELSGRDNVFMSGAILGMRRNEIIDRFDEIVAFAEIERFIDTPVKHYSSGMYLRLAFAVAAHLEPEILLVDEVLAVGDAAFQDKCLGKIHQVAQNGRTVLFVSYNLAAIQTLCSRALVLAGGKLRADENAESAIGTYLRTLETASSQNLFDRADRSGTGSVRLSGLEVFGEDTSRPPVTGRPATLVFHLVGAHPNVHCGFTIYNQLGQPVANFNSRLHSPEDQCVADGHFAFKCLIDELLLAPGRYRLNVVLTSDRDALDHLEAAAIFEVISGARSW